MTTDRSLAAQLDVSTVDHVDLRWRILDLLVAARRRVPIRTGRATPYIMLFPAFALVSILVVGLVILAWRSIHTFDPFLYQQGGLSTTNYEELAKDSFIRSVFIRTTMMALITTAIALCLAIPLAYTMLRTRSRLVRLFLLTVVFLPVLTGDIARTYGWLVILGKEGFVAWVAKSLGLPPPELLGTLAAVGLGTIQILLPLCTLVLLPALYRIDPQLEQAATIMGARPYQVWLRVILPLARPGIAAAVAISVTVGMTDFANPALLGYGLQDYVANQIQSIVLGRDNPYLGSALGMMLLIAVTAMVTLILVIGQRGRRAPAQAGAPPLPSESSE